MTLPGTALVTGANKGIGLEVVSQLASRGWHVFLAARKSEEGMKATDGLKQAGSKVTFLELDVSSGVSIRKAADEVAAQMSCLDVLVNNAGILEKSDESVLDLDADVVLRTFTTNTLGPLLVTQAFLPSLLKSRHPRVINVSSPDRAPRL